MTDDLKERLRNPLGPEVDGGYHTYSWVIDLCEEAFNRIANLEAALAESQAAEEGALMILTTVTAERDAARAGEDALAEAVRRQIAFEAWWITIGGVCPEPLVDAPIRLRSALAAYEARRKG